VRSIGGVRDPFLSDEFRCVGNEMANDTKGLSLRSINRHCEGKSSGNCQRCRLNRRPDAEEEEPKASGSMNASRLAYTLERIFGSITVSLRAVTINPV
jgi:hypothetical protein